MAFNLAQKLVQSHLVSGGLTPGQEIALSVDQTLLASGTSDRPSSVSELMA
jgi:aconitate hydratase